MRNYNHQFGSETFPKAEFCIKTDLILVDKFPAKILCSKWSEIECFKLSQRKIFALSMTSAMLCFLLHLKEFNKNPNIHDFLMELLLLLSLCHLSWAEKSDALNINFYKYLFWQQWIQLNLPSLCSVKNEYFETGSVPWCNSTHECIKSYASTVQEAENRCLTGNYLRKQIVKKCKWIQHP